MEDYESKEEPSWPPMEMDGRFDLNRQMDLMGPSSSKPSSNVMGQSVSVRPISTTDFEELGGLDLNTDLMLFGEKCCTLTKTGKVDLGIGFEEGYDEQTDSTSGWKSKPAGRSYGVALGSPQAFQRKLSTIRTSMWKGRSFDSTGTEGMSSSQSSSVSGSSGLGCMSSSLTSGYQYSPSCGFDCPAPVTLDFSSENCTSENGLVAPSVRAPGNLAGDPRWTGDMCVDRQAQAYRSAASGATAAAVWSGILPPRNTKGSAFSCKVFLGGVPWDITESDLQMAFGMFGNPKIEWPAAHDQSSRNVKGHLYLIFDTEKSVKQLLGSCNYDFNQGHHNWYFKVASKRMRVKEVQVIPWQLADASYVRNGCMTTFGTKTVFVGSLHGMLTAEGLAKVLDDLFQGVVAATVDTDKYKYPIGSGRVTFNSNESYMKALRAVFVDLRTPKFNKKIQIDPFLEDSACSICSTQLGPYFCRDLQCFSYFCHACWQWQHSANNIGHHIPLMRNPRT